MKYSTPPTPAEDREIILVYKYGREISKTLADSIMAQVTAMIPKMIPGRSYTLKRLCTLEYWKTLSDVDKRTAGMYIYYLIKTEKLPLVPIGCEHLNPKKYTRV